MKNLFSTIVAAILTLIAFVIGLFSKIVPTKTAKKIKYAGCMLFAMQLCLFDNMNKTTSATTGNDLSPEMKTYYDKDTIAYAKPKLIHKQFGQVKNIPANGGKIIEFRKYSPFAKALVPLTEGVVPSGTKLNTSVITSTVQEYGSYTEISTLLQLTAIDNNILEATKLNGYQAGETLDTVIREVLNGGTNVQYGQSAVAARYLLVGGDATAANNHYLTVDCIKRAARTLKVGKAKKIGDSYVAIIHPDSAYDITNDTNWKDVAVYNPKDWYEGEIGKIGGVRFVETTEAKVFHSEDLVAAGSTNAARNLTVASVALKVFTIDEALATAEAAALVGRKLIIKGYKYTVAASAAGAAGAATITVTETVAGSPGDGDIVYPGDAGSKGRDVYSTLVLGEDAYGVTSVEGGGLKTIVKAAEIIGGPLNQYSTVGWKALATAERLVEAYMVRIETASTFEVGAN